MRVFQSRCNIYQMGTRINKFIASSGYCSRRAADELILAGRVRINGLPASPGSSVSGDDEVTVDGNPVSVRSPRMIAFYKPCGVVCTSSDRDRAVNVSEYLGLTEHLFPVGRLDKDSEGLLLLTNMGDLAEKIARAGTAHEKEYLVTCKRPLSGAFIDRMRRGVQITIPENRSTTGREEIYITKPCKVDRLDEQTFDIILTEGKNRQIRRMTEALGNKVTGLRRIRIMNIELGELTAGECRELSPEEIHKLEEVL